MNPGRLARGSKLTRFVSLAALEIVFFGGVLLAWSTPAPQGSSKLAIMTKSLPSATVGIEYYAVIAATGGERRAAV